ncbi:MAG: divalent-cation tolerance protein CutA [bacterium]
MNATGRLVEIVTTVSTEQDAALLARSLVEDRLVACASFRRIRSIYRWAGELADESEIEVVLKTLDTLAEAVEARLRESHPYETPAILRLAVEANEPYLAWARRGLDAPPTT